MSAALHWLQLNSYSAQTSLNKSITPHQTLSPSIGHLLTLNMAMCHRVHTHTHTHTLTHTHTRIHTHKHIYTYARTHTHTHTHTRTHMHTHTHMHAHTHTHTHTNTHTHRHTHTHTHTLQETKAKKAILSCIHHQWHTTTDRESVV